MVRSCDPIDLLRAMQASRELEEIARDCGDAHDNKGASRSTERGQFGTRVARRLRQQCQVGVGRDRAAWAAWLVMAEAAAGPLFVGLVDEPAAQREFQHECHQAVEGLKGFKGVEVVYREIDQVRLDYLTPQAREQWDRDHPSKPAALKPLYTRLRRALRHVGQFTFVTTEGTLALAPEMCDLDEEDLINDVHGALAAAGRALLVHEPVGAARARLLADVICLRDLLASPPGSGGSSGSAPGSGTTPWRTEKHRAGHAPADVLRFPLADELFYRDFIRDEGQTRDHVGAHNGLGGASVPSACLALWCVTKLGGPWRSIILDPTAGGPTRAVMAALAGYRYIGTDIRADQVEFTNARLRALGLDHLAIVYHADAREFDWAAAVARLGGLATLLHTCPPYFDKEQYSDLPGDLSAARTYERFLEGYRDLLAAPSRALAPDAGITIVTAEVRDQSGALRRLHEDTRFLLSDAGWLMDERTIVHERHQPPKDAGSAAKRNSVVGKSEFVVVGRRAAPKSASR